MKKSLLLGGALLLMATAQQSRAQLALENFNSGTLPANWVLINDGHTVSSSFTTIAAIQTGLNAAAWIPYQIIATGNYSMITTSDFTPSATADRWIITPSFLVSSATTILKWDDYDLNSGEKIQVWVSPSAGTTAAAFTTKLYDQAAASGNVGTHAISLSSYNGQTIRIAFRDNNNNNWGLILDNVQTTTVANVSEASLVSISPASASPFSFGKSGSSRTVSGVITNNGAQAISSFAAGYRQGSGAAVTQTFTASTPIQPLSSASFTFTTPYTLGTAGSYPIKAWISVTGDPIPSNDTLNTTIISLDSLQPKMVLFEEFNQASCDPCAQASPNVDSVIANNLSRMNAVRYHVWYPGRDCMDTVTKAPFVGTWANTYYAVSGVPDAKMDGYLDVYPGASQFKSSLVASEQAAGAPIRITPTASYNSLTKTYTVTAAIKSFTPFAAGLKCRAVLTIDTIRYRLNQSSESIAQTVFPQVAENMFGGTTGTSLTAFTTNQTQNVNLSWVKDHPWGSNYSVWAYDSTLGGHVTVWVQDDATKSVYQSASIPVSTVFSTGVPVVAGTKGSMSVYPNPAVNEATVSLSLNSTANVSLQVFDVAGKVVFNMPAEKRASGSSIVVINVSKLASGNYFVKAVVDGEVITQKMTIAK